MALKYQGTNGAAAFSYFGDGATSRGDWHEGVNLAAVQKLPVVFICNNNQYAYSTPLRPADGLRQRGRPRPGLQHSGRNCGRQRRAGGPRRHARALEHARAGQGPYLLECKTFRMTGHSAHDAAHYVRQALFEEWGKLDPITAPGSAGCSSEDGPTRARSTACTRAIRAGNRRGHRVGGEQPASRPRDAARRRLRRANSPCRQLIWKPSAKGCGRRWSATPTCSCWARTSASTAAHSK